MSDDVWFAVVGIVASGGTVVLCIRYLMAMRRDDGNDDEGAWGP